MKSDGLLITPVQSADFNDWLSFSLALFPKASRQEKESDLRRAAQRDGCETFMAKKGGYNIGFATLTLRTDYVEGTSTSPVGYLEAIYVDPGFRKQGVGRALFKTGESWCKERGCVEMGSDTWQWDEESRTFHERIGFLEEDILVHFHKKIEP